MTVHSCRYEDLLDPPCFQFVQESIIWQLLMLDRVGSTGRGMNCAEFTLIDRLAGSIYLLVNWDIIVSICPLAALAARPHCDSRNTKPVRPNWIEGGTSPAHVTVSRCFNYSVFGLIRAWNTTSRPKTASTRGPAILAALIERKQVE